LRAGFDIIGWDGFLPAPATIAVSSRANAFQNRAWRQTAQLHFFVISFSA
jgi:hypothetical protein